MRNLATKLNVHNLAEIKKLGNIGYEHETLSSVDNLCKHRRRESCHHHVQER